MRTSGCSRVATLGNTNDPAGDLAPSRAGSPDAALRETQGDPTVTSSGNLWAVGFDDTGRAAVFRDAVASPAALKDAAE